MNAQGRLKPSNTLSAAAAATTTACFHDLLKKNTSRTECCRHKDNITGARCSVETGAASSWLLSEPPEHHAHCASACVRNKQMHQSPKSVKRRRGEGQGRAGQGSKERHSEAETDTYPETDTHVFWMGVIFHLGMHVRILQSFLFKEHVTWMKLLTTHGWNLNLKQCELPVTN